MLQYAQVISSVENVTATQIKHMASNESESLNAEFVQLKASYFANKDETPPEEAVKEQFERYKDNVPGQVSESNPYGFGYRLPDRVQFDYIALKLSDVAAIAKPPTEEEAEQYYQQNRDRQFTQKTPSDPNDPNSPLVAKVKSYAEVADTIMNQLRRQRVTTKAEQILQEARNLADANLPGRLQRPGADGRAAHEEGRRLRQDRRRISARSTTSRSTAAGPASSAPSTCRATRYLRRMFLAASGNNAIPLTQILFSVKELDDHATILLSMPPAAMYVTIGPVQDPMSATALGPDRSGHDDCPRRRRPEERAAGERGRRFQHQDARSGQPSRRQEPEFLRRRAGRQRRQEPWPPGTPPRAKPRNSWPWRRKDGWDKAVAEFNKLYGKQAKADPNDPNVFRVDNQAGLQRISSADLQVLAAQVSNSPASQIVMNQAQNEGQFVDRLYSLIPDQSRRSRADACDRGVQAQPGLLRPQEL